MEKGKERCYSVKAEYSVTCRYKVAAWRGPVPLSEALTIRSAEEVRREAQWGAYNKVLHWINEQNVKQIAKGDLYDAVMDMRPDDTPAPSTDTTPSVAEWKRQEIAKIIAEDWADFVGVGPAELRTADRILTALYAQTGGE